MQKHQKEFLRGEVTNTTAVVSFSELHVHICQHSVLKAPGPREDQYPLLNHIYLKLNASKRLSSLNSNFMADFSSNYS